MSEEEHKVTAQFVPTADNLSLFSKGGDILQISYAKEAVRRAGITCIAIKGHDCAVIATHKTVSGKLIDPNTEKHIFHISPKIGCATAGRLADCRAEVHKARIHAAKFRENFGYDQPVNALSASMASICQFRTQNLSHRLEACIMLFVAFDEEWGPTIYRIDPDGEYGACKAVAVGSQGNKVEQALTPFIKENLPFDQIMMLTLRCFSEIILKNKFSANNIEIGVVTKENPNFKILTQDEIEEQIARLPTTSQDIFGNMPVVVNLW